MSKALGMLCSLRHWLQTPNKVLLYHRKISAVKLEHSQKLPIEHDTPLEVNDDPIPSYNAYSRSSSKAISYQESELSDSEEPIPKRYKASRSPSCFDQSEVFTPASSYRESCPDKSLVEDYYVGQEMQDEPDETRDPNQLSTQLPEVGTVFPSRQAMEDRCDSVCTLKSSVLTPLMIYRLSMNSEVTSSGLGNLVQLLETSFKLIMVVVRAVRPIHFSLFNARYMLSPLRKGQTGLLELSSQNHCSSYCTKEMVRYR